MSRLTSHPILDLENITFIREPRTILDNVTWQIQPGMHTALLGGNGSGKTTLIRILTGYEWPTDGEVTVLGKRFGSCCLPDVRRHIGLVSSAIAPRFPAQADPLDIVAAGVDAALGIFRDFTRSELARARAALEALNAGHLIGREYSTLSQGEQQRVQIARALIARPALLALDEPCGGLDPAARAHFLDDLAQLARSESAPTLLLVTHHIDEIGPWIKRVTALKNGQIFQEGSRDEMLCDSVLGKVFGCKCRVQKEGSVYSMRVNSAGISNSFVEY
ncbi:TPA: molybdenum ABC transporter ATP-binding protein [Candidatus Sumerlaeota bacterium]|nr:molybdenum ABC transporter ATP-binding protein [Candidatus Sumerlaeota bacterium]